MDRREVQATWRSRVLTNYVVSVGRLCGIDLPRPVFIDLNKASIIARWIKEMIKIHSGCFFGTMVSSAVRICAAARREGSNLAGAIFFVVGEPLTEAKFNSIESTGAKAVPGYGLTELMCVSGGCPGRIFVDDVHLFNDAVALIQYPRRLALSELTVNSFFFTSFLSSSPKNLLNVEVDDCGVVEERKCGCLLDELGFTTHLRNIRSFSKLTSEGMTLQGADVMRIVEQVFPKKFGGDSTDYQVVEEEDKNGLTRISILADPNLGPISEAAIRKVFLQEIRKVSVTHNVWQQAGTIQVKRLSPIPGRTGKIMPLRAKRA